MDQRLQRHPAVSDVKNVCLCFLAEVCTLGPAKSLEVLQGWPPGQKEETKIGWSRMAALAH